MHELSIALSMIQMASEESSRHNANRVTALHLKLGPLSGVVKEALSFSYEIACKGTPLEGSQLVIEEIPVVIRCSNCMSQDEVDIHELRCPRCGRLSSDVIQGRELQVVSLELEELEELVS
jgi:hydrogenase nickel incorporation protein HypA/HybF